MELPKAILKDLDRTLGAIPDSDSARVVEAFVKAQRIFVYGLGRSGLMARAFAMRLVHLGRDATIVGGTTTPAIRADDLLVVCSRSGKSPILRHAVALAHREGARAAAIVGLRDTPLGREADCVIRLPIEVAHDAQAQPMGSLFEQALLIYLDSLVVRLMEELDISAEQMERAHFNLP